jgi:CRISPR-associated protein Cmr6
MQKDFDQDQPWKSLPCFAGLVSFLPSFPKTTCRLVLDIVNCHHMDYYGADDDAATAMDNENPNPQFFPAVESGSIFLFSIAPVARAYFLGAESLGFNPMDFAVESLKRGLSSNGIGAKTAAGYGWFEQVQK